MPCMINNIYSSERVHVVEGLSYLLNKRCRKYNNIGYNIPNTLQMDLKSYLWTIACNTNCSNESLVLSLVYMDRLLEKSSLIRDTPYKVLLWVFISVLLAIKFHDDHIYSNAVYSKMGGILLKNLNVLERTCLSEMKFELFVSADMYTKYFRKLMKAAFRVHSKKVIAIMQIATPILDSSKLNNCTFPLQSNCGWKSQSRNSTKFHKQNNHHQPSSYFC